MDWAHDKAVRMTWDIAKSDFGPIDALLELCPIAVVVIGLSPLEPIYLNTVAQQLFDVYSNVSISKSAFGQWELQNTNWFELEESIRVGGQKLTRFEDSGEAARLFRHDVARHSDLMPPSCEASLAVKFVAPSLGARQSSNSFC
jgi:hypothetical protein